MTHTKKIYQFTLILKNVDEQTAGLEDSLYEAGCDDALINFRNGAVYLDFDREAISLEKAIIKAIQEVEASSSGAVVASIAPENLVTESDIAKRLNLKRQTVSLWISGARRSSNIFPKPIMKLSDRSPLWKWSEITQWLYQNQLIEDESIVENAILLEHLNWVLDQRKIKIIKALNQLRKKVGNISNIPHPIKPKSHKKATIKKAG